MEPAHEPVGLRGKVLEDTAMLNAATLGAQIAGLCQSLIVMRLLEPSVYGIWLGLTILLTYGGFAHLGTEHGIELRVPYFRGKGQSARSGAMADSVFLVWTTSTLVLSASVAIFAALSTRSLLVRQGLFAIALVLPLNQQATFYSRWHGAALSDFKLSSILAFFQSWMSLIVVVPLVFFLGLRGVMIGAVAVAALVYLGWLRMSSYRFRGRWSTRLYWQALRIGLPMTLVVLAGGLIQTVDRVVILALLGPTSLGYYGVTSFGGAIVYSLMAQAGSAMSPHITAEMGRSGDSPHSLARFLAVPTIAFAYIGTFAIATLIIVIPAVVTIWLPKYAPGLNAFLLFVPGFFFLGIMITANTVLTLILIARRQQRIVLYVQAAVIAVEGGLGYVLVKNGFGLEGAAFASTLAYACYGLVVVLMAAGTVFRTRAELTGFVMAVLAPFAIVLPPMLIVHLVVLRLLPDHLLARLLVESAVLAALFGAVWPRLNRHVALGAVAVEIRNNVRARFGARA